MTIEIKHIDGRVPYGCPRDRCRTCFCERCRTRRARALKAGVTPPPPRYFPPVQRSLFTQPKESSNA